MKNVRETSIKLLETDEEASAVMKSPNVLTATADVGAASTRRRNTKKKEDAKMCECVIE